MKAIEVLTNVLATVGGLTVVITAMVVFFKNIAEKYISSLIKNSADKELENAKNKLARSMSAYELLLNKEFEYYQKIDKIYASLIVDIQDIYWNAVEAERVAFEDRCNNLKELSLRIIKTIPELKNLNFMYQCYVPTQVYEKSGNVVICLQKDLEYFYNTIQLFFDRKDIQENELENFVNNILMSIALSNSTIKTRLDRLSE